MRQLGADEVALINHEMRLQVGVTESAARTVARDLRNLAGRLRLLCGEDATITLSGAAGAGIASACRWQQRSLGWQQ